MSQSLAAIYLHLVFSTKQRRPFLRNPAIRSQLHSYVGGILTNQGATSLEVGGVEDHVHVLFRLRPTMVVADLVRDLKRDSSKWIKTRGAHYRSFSWQGGYGIFSVSVDRVDSVSRYIRNQEQHHRRESFQDEFRRLCRLNAMQLDERWVWD